MSFLHAIPLWGYFIVLGLAFVTGHLLAFRPDPNLQRGRRMAGRWGSSLLLLVGLLVVSNRNVATILPAIVLAALGGIVSGRTAPPPPDRTPEAPGPGGDGDGDAAGTSGREAPTDGDDRRPRGRD